MQMATSITPAVPVVERRVKKISEAEAAAKFGEDRPKGEDWWDAHS